MLSFDPEIFDAPEREQSGGCGCAACAGHDEVALDLELDLDDDVCPHCGRLAERELEVGGGLVDHVMNPMGGVRTYGKPSPKASGQTTSDRCVDGKSRACPAIKGLEEVTAIDGIGFEYVGGWDKHPGLIYGKTTKKWLVVEANRRRNRSAHILPRVGDGLAAFLRNMRAAGLPVAAILTMGSLNCRCISNTNKLSWHSFGDAIDIAGVRLEGGREVLCANSECVAEDRRTLHRINACLRLSFASVYDYHDRKPAPSHWDHFHVDTNDGGGRAWAKAAHRWGFVREALGLPWKGGFDKACADAFRSFAGPGAVKDKPSLQRAIGLLCMREAVKEPPDRSARYSCSNP